MRALHRSPIHVFGSKSQKLCHPRRLILPISCTLCLASMLYTLYSYNWEAIWNTRTAAGDNLQPTPWHQFGKPEPTSWEKAMRAPKILQCTYLSCLLTARPSTIRYSSQQQNSSAAAACPSFFQWIHEDLAPWRKPGISQQSIEQARQFAAFRVVIVGGRLYTEFYYHCVETRGMFTLWGLVMLLERFPGMVPDVDFMFNCMDRPHFMRNDFPDEHKPPPPLFAYCGNSASFDIPFPDWSFWGWVEANISPWDRESVSIFGGSEEIKWKDRQPRAYWKGNPDVGAPVRTDLLECNKTEEHDFGAHIYRQNWFAERDHNFQNSNLSTQCTHRYKIYAEGWAWSVSCKYIMACGSTVLLINPEFYDFFMRGLLPQHDYWPINRWKLCPSIHNAVQWGNSHPNEAEAIGKQGQDFLKNELNMDRVYDYMLHLLQQYAKLQTFKPSIPPGAQLLCRNSILCIAGPSERKFLERSPTEFVDPPAPCSMPPPDHDVINRFKDKEHKAFKAVEELENSNKI